MTSSTVIAQLHLTNVERRRREGIAGTVREARKRRRPGIPVTAWIAALLLMELAWLFGERRGPGAWLALSIWMAGR